MTKPISEVFRIITRDIENNQFLTVIDKQYSKQWLAESQRRIYLQTRYGFRWLDKARKRREYLNQYDLALAEIPRNASGNIYLFSHREGRFWVFTQKDMHKIIDMNLAHSDMYTPRPEPLPLKNPYTNIPFTMEELRVIDRQLHYKPLIWRIYKESGYDIAEMLKNHPRYLNLLCIPDYVHHMDEQEWWYNLEDAFEILQVHTICRTCINEAIERHDPIYQSTMIQWIKHLYLSVYPTLLPLKLAFQRVYSKTCPIHRKRAVEVDTGTESSIPPPQRIEATTTMTTSSNLQDVFIFGEHHSETDSDLEETEL
jgi:hypothetical protein